jgi:hypothetical protein
MPRSPEFIAVHRGGHLDLARHRLLATWAADCAEHVLSLFSEKYPEDLRPGQAIEVARAWARGEATVGAAQKASVAAHAAARAALEGASREAARAAGHCVATAHMADHSLGAAAYAIRAIRQAVSPDLVEAALAQERQWQRERLPASIRDLVLVGQQKLKAGWK